MSLQIFGLLLFLAGFSAFSTPVAANQSCSDKIPANAVLLPDQFQGINDPKYPNVPGAVPVDGAPNFRKVDGDSVYGTGQPTFAALKTAVGKIEETGVTQIVWMNLRQEPFLYINGIPYSYRDPAVPFKNLVIPNETTDEINHLEICLRDEVRSEGDQNGGIIHVSAEGAGSVIVDQTLKLNSVMTVAEVYDELNKEGHEVTLFRVPITDEKAPTPSNVDEMIQVDRVYEKARSAKPAALVVNCQAGHGRTTTGMALYEIMEGGSPDASLSRAGVLFDLRNEIQTARNQIQREDYVQRYERLKAASEYFKANGTDSNLAFSQWLAKEISPILLVSDIHFNPIADPSLKADLLKSPASRWQKILESKSNDTYSTYGSDTNYALFRSSLQEMKAAVPNPSLILIPGDFFAHKLNKVLNEADFKNLLEKNIQFVASQFIEAFPQSQIVPAFGNNDAENGDYLDVPGGKYIDVFEKAWAKAIGSSHFNKGGYYSVSSRLNPKLRIVVLNTNYWAAKLEGQNGVSQETVMGEFQWLSSTLKAGAARGEKIWLLGHIPPGIDTFATLTKDPTGCSAAPVGLLRDSILGRYIDLLRKSSDTVALAFFGHVHTHEFRLLGGDSPDAVPAIIVPAISPIYFNNPSFDVVTVRKSSLEMASGAAYVFDGTAWQKTLSLTPSRESLLSVFDAIPDDLQTRTQYMTFIKSGSKHPQGQVTNWKAYWCAISNFEKSDFHACLCP